MTNGRVENFISKAVLFYDTCIEYINRWDHSDDVNTLSFVLLRKTPTWAEVEAANEMTSPFHMMTIGCLIKPIVSPLTLLHR